MTPVFRWSRLDDLTGAEVHALLAARIAVFVVEQQCPYQDADALDARAWHLRCEVDGVLAAYARVVEPGAKYDEPSIGRVLTVAGFRGTGLGVPLMREAIAGTMLRYPERAIRISAQSHLQRFYASLGFEPVGEGYLEDDIPHIEMLRRPT